MEEEKIVDAPDDDRAASLGNPAKIPTHVTGEGTDSRFPRPAKKTIKEPMVSQASKAIKKSSGPPQKKKGGRWRSKVSTIYALQACFKQGDGLLFNYTKRCDKIIDLETNLLGKRHRVDQHDNVDSDD